MSCRRVMGGRCCAMLGLVVMFTSPSFGFYSGPLLETVPIERLVANLSKQVETHPKDIDARHALARVHGMAYASKASEIEVKKLQPRPDRDREERVMSPWFSFEPPHVPFASHLVEGGDPKVAGEHLKAAIKEYASALELEPDNLTLRLGYAWCLSQDPERRKQAVAELRKVAEAGWKQEKDLETANIGWHSVVAEASGYLIPLLDEKKDKEEIDTLKAHVEKVSQISRPITPVAIPLRKNMTVADVEARAASVVFDADGSGRRLAWSWISPDAGWLVYDRGGKGQITSALQMFGNVTFWLFWEHGYAALSSLDDNTDGQLSGDELRGFAIWRDVNSNGISESGEVQPLSHYGIIKLACESEQDDSHPDKIHWSPRGVTFSDGTTRPSYDVVLHRQLRSSTKGQP